MKESNSVKLERDTYLEMKEVVDEVRKYGWRSFGLDSTAKPTTSAIVFYALRNFRKLRRNKVL